MKGENISRNERKKTLQRCAAMWNGVVQLGAYLGGGYVGCGFDRLGRRARSCDLRAFPLVLFGKVIIAILSKDERESPFEEVKSKWLKEGSLA